MYSRYFIFIFLISFPFFTLIKKIVIQYYKQKLDYDFIPHHHLNLQPPTPLPQDYLHTGSAPVTLPYTSIDRVIHILKHMYTTSQDERFDKVLAEGFVFGSVYGFVFLFFGFVFFLLILILLVVFNVFNSTPFLILYHQTTQPHPNDPSGAQQTDGKSGQTLQTRSTLHQRSHLLSTTSMIKYNQMTLYINMISLSIYINIIL